MKILFTNCFQSENTGDNAIWKSMIIHIKNAFPEATFTIASQKTVDWDVKQLRKVTDVKVISSSLARGLDHTAFRKLETKEQIVKYLDSKELVKEAREADVFISQGGGYMTKEAMWKPLAYFYLAQKLGKPTIFASQSFIRGVSTQTSILAKMVFDNADLVVAREKLSYEFITEAIHSKNIKMLPDGVFTVKPKKYERGLPKDSVKISIRGYLTDEPFLKEVAKFADFATETMGKIVFLPVGHGEGRNDSETSKKIVELMKHKAIIVDEKLDAGQLMSIIDDGMLVTDRYHGAVYAMAMCTPLVPLSPDISNKMPGLLEEVGYPYPEVLRKPSFEEMRDQSIKVWQNKDSIKSTLENNIPKVKTRAERVYTLINEILSKRTTS